MARAAVRATSGSGATAAAAWQWRRAAGGNSSAAAACGERRGSDSSSASAGGSGSSSARQRQQLGSGGGARRVASGSGRWAQESGSLPRRTSSPPRRAPPTTSRCSAPRSSLSAGRRRGGAGSGLRYPAGFGGPPPVRLDSGRERGSRCGALIRHRGPAVRGAGPRCGQSQGPLQLGSSEAETVTVEGIPFPAEITAGNPLSLLATGITDIEIHFLQIKYTAIGIYFHKTNSTAVLLDHLRRGCKGKTADELSQDDAFYEALVSAPVEKLFRVVVIKEIKGSQYGVQLESSVRDRLVAVDRYDDGEEEALDKVTGFFQSKYLRPSSVITFHFPTTPGTAQISFATEGKDEAKITVENENVAGMIQRWYLGGASAVSPTTVRSLADHFAPLLAA